jgi:hypothetical protein
MRDYVCALQHRRSSGFREGLVEEHHHSEIPEDFELAQQCEELFLPQGLASRPALVKLYRFPPFESWKGGCGEKSHATLFFNLLDSSPGLLDEGDDATDAGFASFESPGECSNRDPFVEHLIYISSNILCVNQIVAEQLVHRVHLRAWKDFF